MNSVYPDFRNAQLNSYQIIKTDWFPEFALAIDSWKSGDNTRFVFQQWNSQIPEQFGLCFLHQGEIGGEMNQSCCVGLRKCDPSLDNYAVFGFLHGPNEKYLAVCKQE